MSSFTVTLPDGSQQSVPPGTRPLMSRNRISPRLADDAIVAKVNGDLCDLDPAARKRCEARDPDARRIRSALRLSPLDRALCWRRRYWSCFPETKLGIGPPIENGFYYDFDRAHTFTPEDLEKIEAKMWELQAKDLPYERI